jgi:hypothetical protein
MKDIANIKIGGRKLKASEYVRNVEQILDENLLNTFDRIGISLVDELQKNAPVGSGALASGIELLGVKERKKGTYSIEIYFKVNYHDYIDKGVKGIENVAKTIPNSEGRSYQFKKWGMPKSAIAGLKKWAQSKNIQMKADSEIKGKKSKKLMRTSNSAAKNLAYIIKRDGIDARKYKDRSTKKVLPEYDKELKEVGYNSLILKVIK